MVRRMVVSLDREKDGEVGGWTGMARGRLPSGYQMNPEMNSGWADLCHCPPLSSEQVKERQVGGQIIG